MHTDPQSAWMILLLALLVDGFVGEYAPQIHPVVWIGKAISFSLRLAPRSTMPLGAAGKSAIVPPTALDGPQFAFGAILTVSIVGSSAGSVWLLLWLAQDHPVAEIALAAFFLKGSFALSELGRAAFRVLTPLRSGDLAESRLALGSLCSRDPAGLSEQDMLAATIESLAENASDSFVAPLFYFVLLGVPGAIGYRAINTLDAMIGYRGPYESLGKFAARLDDLVNFIPARLTAWLFLATAWFCGGNVLEGWRILWRDGAITPSPNGGRPMAAMAGLLEVRLDKMDVYSLGDDRDPITTAKVRQAWRIVLASGLVAAGLGGLALAYHMSA